MEKIYIMAGKARNGKDTVSAMLDEIYTKKGKKVIKVSYGVYPKKYGKFLCNWDGNDETKPRTELQKISVESRKINPNYVVRRVEEDINILSDYCDIIIITDARMKEEIYNIKNKFKNAISIKVERPNFESPLTEEEKNHIIETALDNYDKYDYVIKNNSTIENLKQKVLNIIKEEGDNDG